MRVVHPLILGSLLALGLAWGVCLVAAGIHALTLSSAGWPAGSILSWLGVAGIAAGNFVFMETVADRVIRPRSRRAMDFAELLSAVTMAVSLGVAGVVGLGVLGR